MREPVCIVLNEREQQKQKLAVSLQNTLSEFRIRASRLQITQKIQDVVIAREPQVLVLDYLLGDFSTGLDVMLALSNVPAESRPVVFFLTDEPSVQVAVDAMKLGACDYFEADNAQSVTRLARAIQSVLRAQTAERSNKTRLQPKLRLDELVAVSPESRQLLQRARVLARKSPQFTILHGPQGSGKSTLAVALQHEHPGSFARTIDLNIFTEPLERALIVHWERKPEAGICTVIENADQDGGELLEAALRYREKFERSQDSGSRIILCMSDNASVQAWRRLVPKCEVLTIPPLAKRREDIPTFAQRFADEAAKCFRLKIPAVDSEVLVWLSGLPWPGNLRQLRAVVIDTAVMSLDSPEPFTQLASQRCSAWEAEQLLTETTSPDPLLTARVLELSGYSYRIAAARLGCSMSQLRRIISGT